MKNFNPVSLLTLLLLFCVSLLSAQDCDNDTTSPNIVCLSQVDVIAIAGSGATVLAETIVVDATDECGPVTLAITTADEDDGTPPATTSVTVPALLGSYPVVAYSIDPSGNFNNCFTVINVVGISGEDCMDDTVAPAINCLGTHSAMLDGTGTVQVPALDFLLQINDNCDPDPVRNINLLDNATGFPQGDFWLTFDTPGTYEVELWAIDEAGNAAACETSIEIQEFEPLDCEGDEVAPVSVCEIELELSVIPDFGAIVWAQDIDQGSYDNCSAVELFINLAEDDTGTPPTTNSIQLPDVLDTYVAILYAVDEQGNFSPCFTNINVTGITTDGCTTDEEAPVPICLVGLEVALGEDGLATLYAADIIVDAVDDCDPNPTLSINLEENSTGAPQGNDALQFNTLGIQLLEGWAVDDFGNADFCLTTVNVLDSSNPCQDDTTPPVTVCENGLTFSAIPDFGVQLWAQDVDEGSYDNCGMVELFLTTTDDDTGLPPTESFVQLPPVEGNYTVVLYAVDEAGNFTACWTEVTITGILEDGCTTDTTDPEIFCQVALTMTLSPITGNGTLLAENVVDAASDDCDTQPTLSINLLSNSTGAPQGSGQIVFDEAGIYELEVWAIDDFGNAASCVSTLTVQDPISPDCTDDVIAPSISCEGSIQAQTPPGEPFLIDVSNIEVSTYDACGGVALRMILLSESDGTLPTTTSVEIPPVAGDYDLEIWAVDAAGNTNTCITDFRLLIQTYVEGKVFIDDDQDCERDAGENNSTFNSWTVRVTNDATTRTRVTTTDAFGNYRAYLTNWTDNELASINVELLLPDGLASGCVTSVDLSEVNEGATVVDFPAVVVEDCTFMTVDVATPFLRRCFDNNIWLTYANYSSFPVDEATIVIDLDEFLEFENASVPFVDLGDNRYELQLGTVSQLSGGAVLLETALSCDAELGATHCIEAAILPFDCVPSTGFSELTVTGACDPTNDEVLFTVANTGSSDMAAAQQIRIVEDVIMYMNADPIQLGAGDSEQFSYPANGATWRLEIDQEESFPFGGIAAAFVEGCGGFTPGIATQFLLANSKPNVDVLCLENIGSWDPNDKQALPRGYGEQHYIDADTPLEYLIRFQNTGTDTAFSVRIEDRLSEHLDPTTLVPGAASHPYRLEMKEEGELLFHFDNIFLPDSTTNFEASNGFVQFSIRQQADNPIGTIIENTADIYFDFNEAVVTNTTLHTVGEDFILVHTENIPVPGVSLRLAPNPLQSTTTLTLEGIELRDGHCLLYDAQGREVGRKTFTGTQLQLQRSEFGSAGLYFYRLIEGTTVVAQGKLIVQ